ncbi:MAG: hypothetical protein A2087_10365 [Spirochaetes bacterium GWD1_61_31]|nr:MAG: hypothetical protein A2Y37_12150 [Spirochaetes bacterium GWB1_60_80]OHD30127.1 MAG: hypothetical protein A2004_14010 [Spirochaetes bacterium GWC1_61_12]OHD34619.1 MAG: hypothetical protein A2087_10365 [Spirochaetes bacterium GWD1_61_31]OHD46435.1 MAG: hypothetical protein A2Y35_10270 [Spirochaetes bacterium GWE1_60_18]OHD59491.1 MAG: hypothetical protein A2Y32_10225 [Spirochaetes bacterium GWF1_60_12]HAW85815.1 pantothenate kinase [Spirochaetaceae bacterium]
MLLAIDARNSAVNIGLRDGDAWLTVIRLSPDRTADEYALLMQTALARLPGCRVGRAFMASVVPALTPRLQQAVHLAFGKETRLVGPGIRSGIRIRTEQPAEVGADIVCSALAAKHVAAGACLVVDFATAITISALNGDGELLGVAIAPGLETAARALCQSAAQLSAVPLEAPPLYIGRNTGKALQAGLFFGYTGLVRDLILGMSAEMAEPVSVIATGQDHGRMILERLRPGLPTFQTYRFIPDLALEGLVHLARLNS